MNLTCVPELLLAATFRSFLTPPPNKVAQVVFENFCPASLYRIKESQVARAYTIKLIYDATKASHSSTLSRGVSSSFSLAKRARKFVTPVKDSIMK